MENVIDYLDFVHFYHQIGMTGEHKKTNDGRIMVFFEETVVDEEMVNAFKFLHPDFVMPENILIYDLDDDEKATDSNVPCYMMDVMFPQNMDSLPILISFNHGNFTVTPGEANPAKRLAKFTGNMVVRWERNAVDFPEFCRKTGPAMVQLDDCVLEPGTPATYKDRKISWFTWSALQNDTTEKMLKELECTQDPMKLGHSTFESSADEFIFLTNMKHYAEMIKAENEQ